MFVYARKPRAMGNVLAIWYLSDTVKANSVISNKLIHIFILGVLAGALKRHSFRTICNWDMLYPSYHYHATI